MSTAKKNTQHKSSLESHYEVLKISRNATTSEIINAYNQAKSAFSKDSLAIYSLYSQDEREKMLHQIEDAYATLTNQRTRKLYDEKLQIQESNLESLDSNEKELKNKPTHFTPRPPRATEVKKKLNQDSPDHVNGALLIFLREQAQLSVIELSQKTKIPTKSLIALEKEDQDSLPSSVYLRGFLAILAKHYGYEAKQFSQKYTDHLALREA